MNILGISHLSPSPFGHDSAIAVLDEDSNLFAISEERLSRVKHDGGYPSNVIQSWLKQSNLRLSEIDKISIGFGLEETRVGRRINEQFCCYAKESTNFKRTLIGKKNPLFMITNTSMQEHHMHFQVLKKHW